MVADHGREDLFGLIIGIEAAAARLEARLDLDPDLAGLWRLEAALTEAARSASLEDAPVSERDLLLRMTDNHLSDQNVQVVNAALGALRLLRYPADPRAGMVSAIRRIESVFPAPRALDGRTLSPGADRLDVQLINEAIAPLLTRPGTPVMTALRVAATYSLLTGGTSPMAERSLFSAVEGALRSPDAPAKRGMLTGEKDAGPQDFTAIRASWIVMPATALQTDGLRTWSPTTLPGMVNLLDRGLRSLHGEIGRLSEIRRWLEGARAFAVSGRGAAVRPRFARFLMENPLVTSGLVMRRLDVGRRGAIDLIQAAEAAGLLRCLTPRKQMRYWAITSMAERLFQAQARPHRSSRAGTIAVPAFGEGRADRPDTPVQVSPEERRRRRESMEAAFADLDAILRDTDQILADHNRRHRE